MKWTSPLTKFFKRTYTHRCIALRMEARDHCITGIVNVSDIEKFYKNHQSSTKNYSPSFYLSSFAYIVFLAFYFAKSAIQVSKQACVPPKTHHLRSPQLFAGR